MTQIVKFPDREWAKLASIADHRGVTIADVIVEAAQAAMNPARRPTRTDRRQKQSIDWDAVARLNAEGLSDAEIAHELQRSHKSVGNARRAMNLPANYGPGGRPLNTNRSTAA